MTTEEDFFQIDDSSDLSAYKAPKSHKVETHVGAFNIKKVKRKKGMKGMKEIKSAIYDDEKKVVTDSKEIESKEAKSIDEKDYKELSGECKHLNITSLEVDICTDCGMVLSHEISTEAEWRYYGSEDTRHASDPSRVHLRKNEHKNIFKDLEKYPLPQTIKEKMNERYIKITNGDILRGDSRIGMIFACAFYIYKESKSIKTADELLEIIKISKKCMSKGLENYVKRTNKQGTRVLVRTYTNASDFIPDIMEKFYSQRSHINAVKELYLKIKNKSSVLNASKPQSVACSLVYYYLCSINIQIKCKDFARTVGVSDMTISKLSKTISSILNVSVEAAETAEVVETAE